MNFNTDKIIYRRAELKDAAVLAEHRIIFIHGVFNTKANKKTEQLRTELIQYFNQAIPNKTFVAWLAEYENKIIATSGLAIWQAPLTYSGLGKKGKRGDILNMYTLPKFRKNGIASVLLDKLILDARKLNLEYVGLHATEDGIRIYKNKGFKEPSYPELQLNLGNL
jgi:GNAT superfamily N-acetyltransferase